MDQIKLKGMVVLWLRYSCDGICNRAQRVVHGADSTISPFAFKALKTSWPICSSSSWLLFCCVNGVETVVITDRQSSAIG
jgi:hypothetical protein